MAIDEFRGKYFFLSNFYNVRVTYNGFTYLNNEAAFQAQKDPGRVREFLNLNPSEAKRLGRRVKLRADWEDVKDDIMAEIVENKFTQNKDLMQKLLDTKNEELIEGNTWNNKYWGVCNGKGKNILGKILMNLRANISSHTEKDDV